ncbi:hypothetical protein RBB78_13925 [Tunturiibacter empetritectus]
MPSYRHSSSPGSSRGASAPEPPSHFAANNEDCNGMGKKEALLAYDLK